jgi:hypothetical protein
MTRRTIACTALALLVSACGSATTTGSKPADATEKAALKSEPTVPADKAAASATAGWTQRKPGDFFVHRFSGSFRKIPLTLTEEVVAHDDDLNLIIDYTLEEGDSKTELRVRMDPVTEQIVRACKLDGEKEIDMSIAAYEALLAETMFSPDLNEGEIAKNNQTCLVGAEEHACETREFKVTIGEREGTLSVTRTDAIPGRDVAGEIRDAAGKVLYRAELVDMGRSTPATGVARR